jgi:hypothetical protein
MEVRDALCPGYDRNWFDLIVMGDIDTDANMDWYRHVVQVHRELLLPDGIMVIAGRIKQGGRGDFEAIQSPKLHQAMFAIPSCETVFVARLAAPWGGISRRSCRSQRFHSFRRRGSFPIVDIVATGIAKRNQERRQCS